MMLSLLAVNDDDTDADGVPDWADGFNADAVADTADDQTAGEAFTPVRLSVPAGVDPEAAVFLFGYSGPSGAVSDPVRLPFGVTWAKCPVGAVGFRRRDGGESGFKGAVAWPAKHSVSSGWR